MKMIGLAVAVAAAAAALASNLWWPRFLVTFTVALLIGGALALLGRWACMQRPWWWTAPAYATGIAAVAAASTGIATSLLRTLEVSPVRGPLLEICFFTSCLCLLLANWARLLHPWRSRLLSWSLPVLVGALAAVASSGLPGMPKTELAWIPVPVFLTVAAAVLVAQLLSPLEPLPEGEPS